ncbi:hypothetical protein ABIE59_003999 [Marinobacter sp. MBR-99]
MSVLFTFNYVQCGVVRQDELKPIMAQPITSCSPSPKPSNKKPAIRSLSCINAI